MSGERILVVDDEELILQLCQRVLTRAGYNVTIATEANQAIQACESNRFDILVTDIKMPGLDGIGLIEVIKKFQPNVVPMVITGHGTMESAIESLKLGVLALLLKPFTPKTLVDTVRTALGKREMQKSSDGSQLPLFEITASKTWVDGEGEESRGKGKNLSDG